MGDMMKKKLVMWMILGVSVFAVGCSSGKKADTTVKTEQSVESKSEAGTKGFSINEVPVIEKKVAYIEHKLTYRKDGTISYEESLEYDESGNELSYKGDSKGSDTFIHYTKEYDADDHMIKRISYDENGNEKEVRIYEYGENGKEKMVFESYYLTNSAIITWEKYEYDKSDQFIGMVYYDEDGIGAGGLRYEYDASGNKVKSEKYSGDGSVEWTVTYEYDSKGNVLTEVRDDDYFDCLCTEYEYDSAGNVVYEKQVEKDDFYYEHVYEYDDLGRHVFSASYNSEGCIKKTATLEYDEKGRLIKETTYDRDGTVLTWYEIEYVDVK